ncbi:dihydrolipoyl dehydrogenase family protein [Lacticaseibacillus nasuensis]|uniref:Glutathione reductase n=1 Tax=Lacticaseibacillus nasuensis JCM 17158 TaxID=1291734 RepID=A0A0R1JSJ7_9LACO|nr:NAD(P)/FAD-dependent oxidoreductase [Lacticaseibacillus nasuensis]KRK74076.1 glutathione reductase [Lacticaseibacillus nasuensis JCM 17158]
MDFDVLMIGSGHATWHAAVALLQQGKRVAIVERDLVGGTCTNYGCDAKIALDGPFQLIEQLRRFQGHGVETLPAVNWSDLMTYKHQIIDPLAPTMTKLFAQGGITMITGSAKLRDAHTVEVAGQSYTSEYIVIGTGQRPAQLTIPGAEYIHDSREFLDLPEMPERLVFIGAGIIAMEFAAMAATMGKQVHIVEFSDKALAPFHQPYVARLREKLRAQGVEFHFNEAVNAVTKTATGYTVTTANGLTLETDYILGATGRVANVEGLGLEALGIEASRRGIKVNDHLQTTVANIFASGDVIDKPQPKLTPVATFESNYIASVIAGNSAPIHYPAIPSVAFTMPRLAEVGVSPATAAAQPAQYHTQVVPFGQQLAFQYKRALDAEATLVFDQQGYLVGASLYADDSEDLINLLTLIINGRYTATTLQQQIFAFPSATVGLIDLLTPLLPR